MRNLSSYATAFLNSRGGSIYYGIDDDGRVTGFKAQRSELDELKKDMYSILETIEPKISGDNYLIRFHEVYLDEEELFPDMYVLEVVVPNRSRLNEVFFDHGSDVYLKLDGIRKKLKGSEIVDFILRKKCHSDR
ncbi:ATP-binding protein [Carnobacterium maltaromaticum]|uniref:ATP-binding protein n=1 Tax=Carnobacterium maltaromaticum TaxID=2751 RepID=UPI0021526856|nr:ATP-binding protein [Carnobacterium maltaromaticum]